MRFLGEDDWYQEKELKVAALTSRPLAKVDTYIGDSGKDCVDIIMTNEQMKENFGVSGYQTVSISVEESADAEKISAELGKLAAGVPKCIVKDYSQQIKAQNLYLMQKMLFFYGIAAVLFGISILHIMNSIQYLVTSRKHEFGIMRAMGITDIGFCKMLIKEGLRYGVYSGLVLTIFYMIVQKYYIIYGSCIPVSAPNGIYFLAAVCIGSYTKYCDLYSGGSGFGKNSFKGRNYR